MPDNELIKRFTKAKLRMQSSIHFNGYSPQQVFDVLGDPEKIPQWYLLAKEVRMHPPTDSGEQSFNVVFSFFGDVYEEILHWQPPQCYIYLAKGEDFPIKDYIAEIKVDDNGDGTGVMTWSIYYDEIEGEHYQRILPVMLPPINDASMEKLAPLIGGFKVETRHF